MKVVGISGHQNIPEEALYFVKEGIKQVLDRYGRSFVGVSALAAGADQLFAEEVLRSGGKLHVVLASQGYETSFETHEDLQSFYILLDQADVVETLEHDYPSEDAYLDAGHRVVDLSDELVAVWDGLAARGKGGTADAVHYAREQGKKVVVVWPPGTSR
jgi:predicted Rossmann fold nucleotide-binding protein DprA/Smf involved in DNA uptake